MLTLNQKQMATLSLGSTNIFIGRVLLELDNSYPELHEKAHKLGGEQYISSQIQKANDLNLEIELDVFEYIVLILQFGGEFYENEKCDVDPDWLKSEYVPGRSKIKKLISAANLLSESER